MSANFVTVEVLLGQAIALLMQGQRQQKAARHFDVHVSRGVLLIWIIVGQGPTAFEVGAGVGCLDIFSLKGPLSPKQPTNQL